MQQQCHLKKGSHFFLQIFQRFSYILENHVSYGSIVVFESPHQTLILAYSSSCHIQYNFMNRFKCLNVFFSFFQV